jgi:hypothetical protein
MFKCLGIHAGCCALHTYMCAVVVCVHVHAYAGDAIQHVRCCCMHIQLGTHNCTPACILCLACMPFCFAVSHVDYCVLHASMCVVFYMCVPNCMHVHACSGCFCPLAVHDMFIYKPFVYCYCICTANMCMCND